jgi:hypothetical protein
MKLYTDVKVTCNPKSKFVKWSRTTFSFRAARRSLCVPLGSSVMESSPQARDVASNSTLAEGGELMHALILVAREGKGILCSEESNGFRRWHHYMQSRSPL